MVARQMLLLVACGVGTCLFTTSAFAADKPVSSLKPQASHWPTSVSTRVALVIGNANYPKDPLPFTVNDANDMASTLSRVGFDVTVATNVKLKQMLDVISNFVERAKTAEVALFYFAGHGESDTEGSKPENFLLPVDVPPGQGQGNLGNSISVISQLLHLLATSNGKRINILILDACRTLSVIRHQGLNLRVPSRHQGGLAKMAIPTGTFVAYAAAPGTVTFESPDSTHGRFTQSLLKHMVTPGITIEQVFKRVRSDVEQLTDFKQSPREESSLRGEQDFYFVDPAFTKDGRSGSITRYTDRRELAPRVFSSTHKHAVLNTIRTTPAPSRMRALRELTETRALSLSVQDAERTLSYFWITARRKALRTMAPQLPNAMSLKDVARLIQKASFQPTRTGPKPTGLSPEELEEKHDQYLDDQQETYQELFEHMKSFGKVDPRVQFSQLAQLLHADQSEDRCADKPDRDTPLLGMSFTEQDANLLKTRENGQLLELVENRELSLESKREQMRSLFENHPIALSFIELVELLKRLPEEIRGQVLVQDLREATPDYVTWSQLPMLLKLINNDSTSFLILHWVDEGILDANLSQHEKKVIDKVLHEQVRTQLSDMSKKAIYGAPAEMWENLPEKLDEQWEELSKNPLINPLLDELMACNERISVSSFSK